ncbi:MAG: serine protease [Proteobacteria bacterium]|nr:serine protease [Pseudomonadota bacterium]
MRCPATAYSPGNQGHHGGSAVQPRPENYEFDLDHALQSVVGLKTIVPADAFTADTLGTERLGHGVLIGEHGVVLTIGYLVTEAETVWLRLANGHVVPGHVIGFDQETGFGLVQALGRIDLPSLPLGDSSRASVGDPVVVAGIGGRQNSVAASIVARQEFAGYWEYVLDQALFTSPSHPHWGGTATIGQGGKLIGIGSLQVQQVTKGGGSEDINMIVPIDLLKPILDDMLRLGRPQRPARPWLGLYATEVERRIAIAGVASKGPAKRADIRNGDVVLAVGDAEVRTLAAFFRKVWALGPAGVDVPLRVVRGGRIMEVHVKSADRRNFLKGPVIH